MAISTNSKEMTGYALALARISLGLIMLWAFFDKAFGWGFATCRDSKTHIVTTMCKNAWAQGGSPTTGFLKNATKGPLAGFYHNLVGNGLVDFLFMAALLLIGVALVFGIAMRLAVVGGSVLFLMMWSAVLPPSNHPILDDHIVYIFTLFAILGANNKQKLGLAKWWSKQDLVKQYPVLQ